MKNLVRTFFRLRSEGKGRLASRKLEEQFAAHSFD